MRRLHSAWGSEPKNPGLSASGLQNGQPVSALSGLNNSFDLTVGIEPGSYPVYVTGKLMNPNYVVSGVQSGIWIITPVQAPSAWMASQATLTPTPQGRLCVDSDGPFYGQALAFSLQSTGCTP